MRNGLATLPDVRPVSLSIGGLLALAAALGIGRFVYTPILPHMMGSLDLTSPQAGLIASSNFLGYLMGAVFAAHSLPGGARLWLMLSLGTSALTTACMGLSESMLSFMLLRFIGGGASALVLVLASSLVLDRLARAGRAGLSAVHFSGVGAGIAVSALVIQAIAIGEGEWRAMWFIAGLISLAATIAVACLVPVSNEHVSDQDPIGVLRTGFALRRLVMAYGLFGFGYVITATFIVTMVRTGPQSRAIENLVWLVVGLFAMPAVGIWSAIGRRFGELRAFSTACLLEASGVALSVLSTGSGGLLLSAALLGATFMGLTALGMVAAREMSGGSRRALALMTAAFGIGQAVGPVVAGFAFDVTGSFYLPTLTAAAALVLASLLVIGPTHVQQTEP